MDFFDAVDWEDRDNQREIKMDRWMRELETRYKDLEGWEEISRRLARLERDIRDLKRKIEGWEREEERLRLREKRERLDKERKIREEKELRDRVWLEEKERARVRAMLSSKVE